MKQKKIKRATKYILNPIISKLREKSIRLRSRYIKELKKPIYKNTILIEAYLGESVTGNCLALFEEMYTDKRFKNFKFVWSVKNKKNINLLNKKNVKFVIRHSNKYVKYLARSEYLISDTTFPYYFNKRKNQKYTIAWHGTPFKTIGNDIVHSSIDAHKNVMKNILHTDYFISPSK